MPDLTEASTPDLGGWLSRIADSLPEPLNDEQREQLLHYARLLREWNEKINLTAILDDEGIAVRHFLDSLTILPELRDQQAKTGKALRLVDVGTGAGFPGLADQDRLPGDRGRAARRLGQTATLSGDGDRNAAVSRGSAPFMHVLKMPARSQYCASTSMSLLPALWPHCRSLPSIACRLSAQAVFSWR